MKAVLWVLITLAALIAFVVGIVGVWWLGWFVKEKNVDRQVGIDNRQKGTQVAWRDEAYNLINQSRLLTEDSPAQEALERQACEIIGRLTPAYSDEELLIYYDKECA